MKTLNEIDEYNSVSPLWLNIEVIIICCIIGASLLLYLFIWLKCTKGNSQHIVQSGERKPKPPTMKMIPLTPSASTDIQTRIQKALEEKVINLEHMRNIYWGSMEKFNKHPVLPNLPIMHPHMQKMKDVENTATATTMSSTWSDLHDC